MFTKAQNSYHLDLNSSRSQLQRAWEPSKRHSGNGKNGGDQDGLVGEEGRISVGALLRGIIVDMYVQEAPSWQDVAQVLGDSSFSHRRRTWKRESLTHACAL
jgi:hypothetical protein